MALTATISLSQSTVTIHEPTVATLTVSNSGGAAVNMSQITPRINFTGDSATEDASSVGVTNSVLINPANQSVPAGGSTIYSFQLVVHAPSTGVDGLGTGTYDVSAQCYGADGSSFKPSSAATLTVNPVLPLF